MTEHDDQHALSPVLGTPGYPGHPTHHEVTAGHGLVFTGNSSIQTRLHYLGA